MLKASAIWPRRVLHTRHKMSAGRAMEFEINLQTFSLPHNLSKAVDETLDEWNAGSKLKKLWGRDASLWTSSDESSWLGWLDIVNEQQRSVRRLANFAEEVKDSKFARVLLLAMGGSSLYPEVIHKSFGKIAGFPELHVLDSTDPTQIKSFEKKIDLANTLFIVSSKSGTTLEPNIFKQYFFERVKQTIGAEKAGSRFIAVTDPGSKLEKEAETDKFRYVFHGDPTIGGRYSALSNFGIVPAAVMGLDGAKFLDRTEEMVQACAASVPVEKNPGVMLGIILGSAAKSGRDKITIITSPAISDLGAWLEQLIAESTGKQGKGIISVAREHLASPEAYGNDRVFAYVRLENGVDADQETKV